MEKVKFAQEKVRRGQGSPVEFQGASPSRRKGMGTEDTGKTYGEDKGRGHRENRVGVSWFQLLREATKSSPHCLIQFPQQLYDVGLLLHRF